MTSCACRRHADGFARTQCQCSHAAGLRAVEHNVTGHVDGTQVDQPSGRHVQVLLGGCAEQLDAATGTAHHQISARCREVRTCDVILRFQFQIFGGSDLQIDGGLVLGQRHCTGSAAHLQYSGIGIQPTPHCIGGQGGVAHIAQRTHHDPPGGTGDLQVIGIRVACISHCAR